MGVVQAKPSQSSSSRGFDKLKQENGYVGKGELMADRRSTGQRDAQRESGGRHRLQTRKHNGGEGEGEGKANMGKRVDVGGNGENVSQKTSVFKRIEEDELIDGWPKWLVDNFPREVLTGMVPKSAESYVMLSKVGQGTYSNVYKARDKDTKKIVALKKVRFDTSEPESVKFMAREIMMLQKLDHPNIIKLEGLATSRMQYSLYLVFDFMQTDLHTIISRPEERLTEPQVKCYMHQLLSGLQHCHDRGILHRDIKGSNLLIDKDGMLKIADFGLANYYTPLHNRPLTNRVVTLWYRAPELLLGATDYGVGIDLWSAGCLLGEMFAGRPIMPGSTEVEQIHRIFKLCGKPSEEYWKRFKLSKKFRIPQFKPSLIETFRELPESSLGLLSTLLALEPAYRGCASLALQNVFFHATPLACNLSDLPVLHNKDDDLKDPNEDKKYRNARMKQRSRTVRERRTKDQATTKPKEDSVSSTKGREKTAKPEVQSQEPPGSTSSRTESPLFTTPSTSSASGAKLSSQTENSPFLLSPEVSSKQRFLPNTQDHPNADKNIMNLPPLPISRTRTSSYVKDNDMYRLNRIPRSASTRDFGKTRS